MIVTMSKVEIAGPKDLLQQVLALLRELGLFQVDPAAVGFIEKQEEHEIRSFALDERTAVERLSIEEFRGRIDELFSSLPSLPLRESYIEPESVIDSLSHTVDRHRELARGLAERRDELQKERGELDRYAVFLGALSALMTSTAETPNLEFIGLTIREPEMVDRIRDVLSRITDWKYELQTEQADDGTLVGLITVEKQSADRVKRTLSD